MGSPARRRLGAAVAAGVCLTVAGCGVSAVLPVTPAATPGIGGALPPHPTLAVAGGRLLRDGTAFVPNGVSLAGFLAPYPTLSGAYADARDAFGPDELASARGYGANTIRFVVGQSALAPSVGSGGVAFRRSLVDAVGNARALGFVVVVALDGSAVAGESGAVAMPDPATARAWSILAPLFAGDRGVAFELFNAPAAEPSPVAWLAWAGGGTMAGQAAITGMEVLIATIRAAGAANVVIADGLDHGHTLDGAPLLSDSGQATVYGVEPYQHAGDGRDSWTRDFGVMAGSRPVIATQWDASSLPPATVPQLCTTSTPELAAALLDYLAGIHVGMIGYAFDLTGTLVRDLSFGLTSYDRFSCGAAGGGPGEILGRSFTATA